MATRNASNKRARLIATAARLTHAQGFYRTSLADVAGEYGVPLGNVFYYFKTKDALGDALIDRMHEQYERARARWASEPDARRRLEAFIQMTIDNRASLTKSGCPVGTLCAELHKAGGPLADHAATLFADMLTWIEEQFRAMGKAD